MKRLLILAAIVAVVAAALAYLPLPFGTDDGASESAPPPPAYAARVELTGDGFIPPKVRVPKDHAVVLMVLCTPTAPEGMLTITGYGDRVAAVDVGPGVSRELSFVSALPGDDFAFEIAGRIVGRLEVAGSHLPEGHE